MKFRIVYVAYRGKKSAMFTGISEVIMISLLPSSKNVPEAAIWLCLDLKANIADTPETKVDPKIGTNL
jgi:hypothetical protein